MQDIHDSTRFSCDELCLGMIGGIGPLGFRGLTEGDWEPIMSPTEIATPLLSNVTKGRKDRIFPDVTSLCRMASLGPCLKRLPSLTVTPGDNSIDSICKGEKLENNKLWCDNKKEHANDNNL